MTRGWTLRAFALLALALASLAALAACASDDPTATPTATSAPQMEATEEPAMEEKDDSMMEEKDDSMMTEEKDDSMMMEKPEGQYGGTLAYWIRSDPPGWDPWGRTRFWDPTRKIAELVFNPLYSPAAQLGDSCEIDLDPEIAESWEYVEPTILEFKLREGIQWHDKAPLNGRELTADDVVYTYNERFAKGLAGQAYVGQVFFDRAEAVDDHTVRIHLKQPFDFVRGVTSGNRQGWIVAEEASGEEALADPNLSWVGTGPFMFSEHETGTKVVFERNPNYFKEGLPYADTVEAHIIPDAATRLASLRSGLINVFPAAGPRVQEEIQRTNPDFFVKSCPSLFHLGIRMRLDKAPWNDVRVRRAVSMALDREAIIATALRGNGEVVLQGWPLDPETLQLGDYPEEIAQYMQYNPDKAKELLAEAGFPDGFSTTVVWTPAYGDPWQGVAEIMLTMLRAVGIDAQFNIQEYGPFLGMGSQQTWDDLYFGWNNSFDFNDLASTYYWSGQRPANGLTLAPDATLDGLVADLWASTPETRPAVLTQLQHYVASAQYRITSPVWGNGIVARPEVKNVGWRGTNKMYHQIFENAWLEQ